MKHVAFALLVVACRSGEPDKGPPSKAENSASNGAAKSFVPKLLGACDRMKADGICAEYWSADVAMAKEHCAGYSGTWIEKCPSDGALLRCVQQAKTVFETHNLFYAPIWKPESLEGMCKPPDEKRAI